MYPATSKYRLHATLFGILLSGLLGFTGIGGSLSAQVAGTIAVEDEEGDKKKIEVIQADELVIENDGETNIRRLSGNVILKQDDIILECDSAIQYPNENNVRSYGNVHISQGDTVHAYGDSLRYDGNRRLARMMQNVRLEDQGMTLRTEDLSYDLNSRTAIYRNGGKLDDGETTLTSKRGYYYARSGTAFFRDSVYLDNPDYALEADTLEYDINTDLATFHGPTKIYNQDNIVYCEGGYYDGEKLEAVFRGNAVLEDPPQTLYGDSIYYDRKTGYGQAWGNVRFVDTAQQIMQASEFAEYYADTKTILATDRNVLSYMVGEDSVFISGDTIRTWVDSLDKRQMVAYGNVRIFKSDLQGICDSLLYTDTDSSINLFGQPVMWSDSSQFTADTIRLLLKNSKLHRILMRYNGFIANESDSLVYNQIKGRNITGHLRDQQLYRMDVDGNGESIYYATNDEGAYVGMNKILCSEMKIYLEGSDVKRISSKQLPDGEFKPMEGLDLRANNLEGFSWRIREKPTSAADLHRKTSSVFAGIGLSKGGGEIETEGLPEVDGLPDIPGLPETPETPLPEIPASQENPDAPEVKDSGDSEDLEDSEESEDNNGSKEEEG